MVLAPHREPLVSAKAGTQFYEQHGFWIPAFAGMSGGQTS